MTGKEIFNSIMHFKAPDRMLVWHWEFGPYDGGGSQFWAETIERWHSEGLPHSVDSAAAVNRYFNVDKVITIDNMKLLPRPMPEVLEEDDEFVTYRTGLGKEIIKEYKGILKESSMAQHISYAISDRDDWERVKRLMDYNTVDRYTGIDDRIGSSLTSEEPVGVFACSLFGWLRNCIGLENISYLLYDDRPFIEEMMEYITEFCIETLRRTFAGKKHGIDFFDFWEDMACKSGPLLSPQLFKELMMPRYKRITDYIRKEMNVDIISVDSDGNTEKLIPLWLEAGINCVYPLEVAAGMDVLKLRKEYGKDLLMIGGVDKRALAAGKEAIRREVDRILPVVASGGYIPAADHSVPHDVSFESYMYYHRLLIDDCNVIYKK